MAGPRLFVVVALLAGCALRGDRPPSPPTTRGTVALIVEGSAFTSPEARTALARRLEAVTGRAVVLLPGSPSPSDPDVVAAAKATVASDASLARHDWRTEPCTRDTAVLAAVARRVDALYRVSVGRSERERPLTTAEAARPGFLATIRVAKRGVAREETISGEVVLWSFGRRKDPDRVPVARTVVRREPSPFTGRTDPLPVVDETLRKLPSPTEPQWEAMARRLLASRCPVLALAIAETRISDRGVRRGIRAAALGGTRAKTDRPAARRGAPAPAPAPVDAAAAPDGEQQDASSEDERYSCPSLCRMHMIELCNQDKALWDAHGRRWDITPCGSMRDYDFLQDCYRRQWLSGAYHDACLSPCEGAAEGRERLLHILQAAGCLRPRRS